MPRRRRPDPAVWGNTRIEPGQQKEVRILVSESYSGADIKIPLLVWRGHEPGPTVCVTGAVHGDEIAGTGAIRHFIYERPCELDAGTLILVPVVNLMGFERHERYLPDRRDLNRCFPGSSRGSLASRLARVVFDEVISRSDFGIDLHTAATNPINYPNVRANLDIPELRDLARAFGASLIVSSTGPSGSLRHAATGRGCPTLILEAGEVGKVQPTVVEFTVRGLLNCLRHLGMTAGEPEDPPFRVETDATTWVRAQNGGFLRFHVGPGEFIEKGQLIATNISLTGRRLNRIKAPRTGIVLGMTTLPAVSPGDPICHIAFPRQRELARVEKKISGLDKDDLFARIQSDMARTILITPSI
jgi:predicted deacylase